MKRSSILTKILLGIRAVKRAIVKRAVKHLTDPIALYSSNESTNLRALKARLQECDVLLVSGNARISNVVKVLTTSPWSHVVLYVGNRQDLLTEEAKEEWSKLYGASAMKDLVIDADPIRGVHLRPIDEYVGLMVRQCRPTALTPEDRAMVMNKALSQLGRRYDIQHILRLMLFFGLPWKLFPERLRRFIRDFTLSESDTICSRVLSESFHEVGYPIRPIEVIQNKEAMDKKAIWMLSGLKHRGRSAIKLLAGGRIKSALERLTDDRYVEYHVKGTRHITPADYDLSRFFAIIKDTSDTQVNYRELNLVR